MSQSAPFDPFSFDDDDRGGAAASPTTVSQTNNSTGSNSYDTSKTTNTTNKKTKQSTNKQKLESVQENAVPKPLPPRLNVRLTLHEEVSSTAVVDPAGDGGSLSQLSIEGKVMVSVSDGLKIDVVCVVSCSCAYTLIHYHFRRG